MLRAILHSKDRTIKIDKKLIENEGINFRSLYPETEDFFTATIFARLCYLPGEELWGLFQEASNNFLPSNPGHLLDRTFWPHWADTSGNRKIVEPDLFLRFQNFDLIIEAKRYDEGNSQDLYQIEWELNTYLQQYRCDNKPHYLLAIGGVWHGLKDNLALLSGKVKSIKWHDLFDAVRKTEGLNRFLCEDLLAAFELHGIREVLWLKDITEKEEVRNMQISSSFDSVIAVLSFSISHLPNWNGLDDISAFPKITNYHELLEVVKWQQN